MLFRGRLLLLALGVGLGGLVAGGGEARAQDRGDCPGYAACPPVDMPAVMEFDRDARRIDREIARSEATALEQARHASDAEAPTALGRVVVYDRALSVFRNQACFSCHTARAGFTGGISFLNQTTGSMPGSLRTRTGNRKPQSAAYAAFAPVLHYRASTQDFVGGNFWDSRATGLVAGNPAADQALGPFTNPMEMALADPACAIWRVAHAPYAELFQRVAGSAAFSVKWPSATAAICDKPNDGDTTKLPVTLDAGDRSRIQQDYIRLGQAVAVFEASSEVSPFSSRFDAFLAGKTRLSDKEMAGYKLFNGKAQCSDCHLDSGTKPMFTDFTSVNIGIPKNPGNPYFLESKPDRDGYVANPAGRTYVDDGLAGYLTSVDNTNSAWRSLAPNFVGTFQVATLRNVARLPRPGFRRAYMHNGFFTDLKTVVHFYNTRDVLPRCPTSARAQIGVTCWPAPEQAANLDRDETGHLGLTDCEEDEIVAFLRTLDDEDGERHD